MLRLNLIIGGLFFMMAIVGAQTQDGISVSKKRFGIFADSCNTGIRLELNDGAGVFAWRNKTFGFHANRNSLYGFYASGNDSSGFYVTQNGGNGFHAVNNFNGYAAFLTSPWPREDPAVYIAHEGDNQDLEFGGHARIISGGSYALTMGGSAGESFQVRNQSNQIVFKVIDNGNIDIGPPGGSGRFFTDGSYVFNIDQENSPTEYSFHIRDGVGADIARIREAGNTVFNVEVDAVAFNSTSDIRYKQLITPLKLSLSNLDKIRGVRYHWDRVSYPEKKFTNDPQIGFIAQELEQVYPELVHTNEEGYKSVSYDKMTAVLVEAVKELNEKNEELQLENKNIKKQLVLLNELEIRLAKLENQGGH